MSTGSAESNKSLDLSKDQREAVDGVVAEVIRKAKAPAANRVCKNCKLRPRANGSSRCSDCTNEYRKGRAHDFAKKVIPQ